MDAPRQGLQLVITVTQTGQVKVEGPIADKATCYALLELARDAIKDFKAPTILIPTPLAVDFGKKA